MTYLIKMSNIGDWLWSGAYEIKDAEGNVVMEGSTKVISETEVEAKEYVEKTLLVDLRSNYPRQLSTLVFPWESTEEVI